MENSFGTGGPFRSPGGDKEPDKTQVSGEKSPRFKWEWRLFAAYGCVWIAIFFGLVCVQKAVGVFLEQQRIIQDLIDGRNSGRIPTSPTMRRTVMAPMPTLFLGETEPPGQRGGRAPRRVGSVQQPRGHVMDSVPNHAARP